MRLSPLICVALVCCCCPVHRGDQSFSIYGARVLFRTWKSLYIQNGPFRQIADGRRKVLKSCATFLWSHFASLNGCTFQTLTLTGFLALAQFSHFRCQHLSRLWRLTHSCQESNPFAHQRFGACEEGIIWMNFRCKTAKLQWHDSSCAAPLRLVLKCLTMSVFSDLILEV